MIRGAIQRFRSPDQLLRVALWAVLLAVVAFTRADPDLWGHVRFGMDILRDSRLAQTDPYSFTSDRPWVNHEWAAEIMTGAAFQFMGNAGLVLLKVAVVVGLLLLLQRVLRRQGVEESRIRDYLGGLAVITTIQQAHHVRPQIFSLLFFAVLLTCLIEARRGRRRALFALPLLFALWANLHGGWIVGGAVLALWTSCVAVRAPVRATLWYLAAGVASLLATLVNPYGAGLWRFLWTTVGIGRADITDWQPVYLLGPSVWVLWVVTAALATVALVHHCRTRVAPEIVAIIVTLAAASFRVNRLLGFFALATLFLLGDAIATLFRRRNAPAPVESSSAVIAIVAAILALALTAGAVAFTAVNVRCVRIDPRMTPAPGAVRFLEGHSGRLLVWFGWGEYAIWHLAPAFRVSIDGRRETVYSAGVQDRHLRFFFDAPGGASLPDTLAADYVWIPPDLPAANRLRSSGWTEAYADANSVIFARAAGRQPTATDDAPSLGPRCFPGP